MRTRSAAGLVVACGSVVACAVALTGCTGSARDASGQVTVATTTDPYQVAVGDCTGEMPAGSIKTVTLIPCSQAHYWEAFSATTLTDASYPGQTAIGEKATTACAAAFKEFVGVSGSASKYSFNYFYPDQNSWDSSNDRQILCLAGSEDGNITGTLKGIKK
jgi:hypothetical protein